MLLIGFQPMPIGGYDSACEACTEVVLLSDTLEPKEVAL